MNMLRTDGDDDVGAIPVSGDDLEPVDSVCIADNIVEDMGPVFFDPI
jgi:hypothetical protein